MIHFTILDEALLVRDLLFLRHLIKRIYILESFKYSHCSKNYRTFVQYLES